MDPSRISVRPFELSDVDDFLSWAKDDRVTRHLRWNSITSREEALEHLEKIVSTHPWRRSICLDNRSIGYISIWPAPGDDRHRANLGYALAADYWGQGIVTAALKRVIPGAFKDLPGLVRIEAFVEEQNRGSQRALEKVGFQKEGFLRKYGFNKDNQLGENSNSWQEVTRCSRGKCRKHAVKIGRWPAYEERISVRPFELSDVDDFFSWAKDDRVTYYLRWKSVSSREEALEHLEKVVRTHPWRRSICLDKRSIGYISIRPAAGGDSHRAKLGYAIAAEYWGQGIVATALKMVIPSVFEDLPGLLRVEALVEEEQNDGSQRVLQKVGFKKEGFLRKYGFNKGELGICLSIVSYPQIR